MSIRVAFTNPEQHTLEAELQDRLRASGAQLVSRTCSTTAEIMELCDGAAAVLTSAAVIDQPVIERLTNCRIIARIGTGYDNIDVGAATEQGIPVTNVPNFCTEEVASHTIALLLASSRRLVSLDRQVRAGIWRADNVLPARRLSQQTLGLVGFGEIGRAVAQRALALGLRVLFFDSQVSGDYVPGSTACASLEELLRLADYVSLHVPLSRDTYQFVSLREFRLMKPTAVLINTSRGGVVNQADLVKALNENVIAGAALDVLEKEPPSMHDPLLSLSNVILSPHCASHSQESLAEVRRRAVEEVLRALDGRPLLNVVNREALAARPGGLTAR